MSFSGDVKEELSGQMPGSRHCRIAELTAIITMCGAVRITARDRVYLLIHTENLHVAKKFVLLLRKGFGVTAETSVQVRRGRRSPGYVYTAAVTSHEEAVRVLRAAGLLHSGPDIWEDMASDKNRITARTCCKRAYLRGAFLAAGSVSDPRKSYHTEIVCQSAEKAAQLRALMSAFGLDARTVERKGHSVVYMKEGEQIVDLLNVMEAPRSLMELENIRILREISNSINRKVNCEAANIHKTVDAAVRQIDDIRYIQKTTGFDDLPEGLREMARIRLEYPDDPLGELGKKMVPPLGKSGVNHRLRKLSAIAEQIRSRQEKN